MAEDPLARVRRICLALPEATEQLAWGEPTWRVRKRLFAMYADNHHGDGRVALWCNAPLGVQEHLVASNPAAFFVPPYVGVRGWIGIVLDLAGESELRDLVVQSYAMTAPAAWWPRWNGSAATGDRPSRQRSSRPPGHTGRPRRPTARSGPSRSRMKQSLELRGQPRLSSHVACGLQKVGRCPPHTDERSIRRAVHATKAAPVGIGAGGPAGTGVSRHGRSDVLVVGPAARCAFVALS
jgi:hypothetical protein